MATATLILSRNTINITAGRHQFTTWWQRICRDPMTCTAAKYANTPREAFGIFVIDAAPDLTDVIEHLWRFIPLAWQQAH